MSYQERKTLTTIICGTVFLIAYTLYCHTHNYFQPGTEISTIARSMLMFIGIGVVAMIVIQIIFHILYSIGLAITEQIKDPTAASQGIDKVIDRRIKAEFREDERDAVVGLKSARIGYALVSVGFIVALVSLALNYSAVTMLHILCYSWMVGTLIEGAVQLYLYRRTN